MKTNKARALRKQKENNFLPEHITPEMHEDRIKIDQLSMISGDKKPAMALDDLIFELKRKGSVLTMYAIDKARAALERDVNALAKELGLKAPVQFRKNGEFHCSGHTTKAALQAIAYMRRGKEQIFVRVQTQQMYRVFMRCVEDLCAKILFIPTATLSRLGNTHGLTMGPRTAVVIDYSVNRDLH